MKVWTKVNKKNCLAAGAIMAGFFVVCAVVSLLEPSYRKASEDKKVEQREAVEFLPPKPTPEGEVYLREKEKKIEEYMKPFTKADGSFDEKLWFEHYRRLTEETNRKMANARALFAMTYDNVWQPRALRDGYRIRYDLTPPGYVKILLSIYDYEDWRFMSRYNRERILRTYHDEALDLLFKSGVRNLESSLVIDVQVKDYYTNRLLGFLYNVKTFGGTLEQPRVMLYD
jgi:hypothetical protein